VKTLVLAAAIAAVTVACGAYAMPGASPSPSPRGGMGFDVTATNTDRAVTMRVGQKLEVVLRAGSGLNNWSHPQSSDHSVLAPAVDPAATAAIGVTLAAFEAMKPGQVDVTSNASPKCPLDQACPMFVAVYSLKVTITP
jgi:hypothetical protein